MPDQIAPGQTAEVPALRIGPLALESPVVLAPMAGVTNAPFRSLCRRFGGGLYVSEMISARAVCERNTKTEKLASFTADEPIRSLQLQGVDPYYVAEAIRYLVGNERVDHIDLNFGCPVRKITRHGGGGALPYKRKLYAALCSEAVKAAGDVPVTVKFRVGIDDTHRTFLDAGRIAEDSGISAVALHGRTVEQLYSGSADWSTIAELKQAVASIPVLGNGDIWAAEDAVAMIKETGCDGVVIGRGCLGRPWLFEHLECALSGRPVPNPPSTATVIELMREHAQLLVDWFGPKKGVLEMRKHTGWYLKGYPIGSAIRGQLAQISTLEDLDTLCATIPIVELPEENYRVARGHTRGPQQVYVPEGWLEDPWDDRIADAAGDDRAASGG